MKKINAKIQAEIVKATSSFWLFISYRGDIRERMHAEADGKLTAFCLVFGGKAVEKVIRESGQTVPSAVLVHCE